MKKIYTLILAMFATLGMAAQNFTFYIGDNAITPGSTITYAESDISDSGDPDIPYSVMFAPEIFVGSDMTCTDATIRAVCTTGQKIQVCVQPSCKIGTKVEHTKVRINATSKQPLDFHYEDEFASLDDVPKNVTVEFSVFSAGDEKSTLKQFTLIINPDNSSVTLVENDRPLTVTAGGLAHNISGNATLTLYNALGSMVEKTQVNGQGTVATDHLQRGVYIYQLRGQGVNHSGKIYIK